MKTIWSTAMTDVALGIEIIRRPTARRMKLSVDPRTGKVRLVLPKRAALDSALDWARGQQGWIDRQLEKLPEPWPILSGMIVPMAGQSLRLQWSEGFKRTPVQNGDRIEIGGPLDLMAPRLVRWLKKEALTLLHQETLEFAARASVSIGRIGIGDPGSRWGSCAHNGDIRYSWRLILAPENVRRATVAHEVAHRSHMDHSAHFHAKVAEIYDGDPGKARAWLRTNGARLHWFGRDGCV